MDNKVIRKIAMSLFLQEDSLLGSEYSKKGKMFNEAFKKTISLQAKIQTLSFNFCEHPMYIDKPSNIINTDWLLEMGILHIYLECYLVCEIFKKYSFLEIEEKRGEEIKKFRNKRLSHIENFELDYKAADEIILDIKYMVDLISKYMCELINEEKPSYDSCLIVMENNNGEVVQASTIKQNTYEHLDKLYNYFIINN